MANTNKRHTPGHVYFAISDCETLVKIGFSTDPATRVERVWSDRPHKSTARGPLSLVATRPGVLADEARVHGFLRGNQAPDGGYLRGVCREWYRATLPVLALIHRLKTNPNESLDDAMVAVEAFERGDAFVTTSHAAE